MEDPFIKLDSDSLKVVLDNTKWWFAGMALIAFFLWRWFAYKDRSASIKADQQRDEEKSKRAERYSSALDNLTEAINGLKETTTLKISRIDGKIDSLTKKANGMLSFSESIVLINAFFSNFSRYSCDIISQSIRENNYARYQEHIKVRVKTQLGQALSSIRTELSKVSSLGVDATYFFVNVINEPEDHTRVGRHERFLIVDRIWDSIERFYHSTSPSSDMEKIQDLAVRIESAIIATKNEVNDYLAEVTDSVKKRSIKDMTDRYPVVVNT